MFCAFGAMLRESYSVCTGSNQGECRGSWGSRGNDGREQRDTASVSTRAGVAPCVRASMACSGHGFDWKGSSVFPGVAAGAAGWLGVPPKDVVG